ncbi:MAG: RNA polymerase sigma factor [Lutimonas sp.]
MEEALLVERLKNIGTQELAFKDLVETHKERLYWHIRKIVINHDDADDVLQNTFLKVFKSIANFKGESKIFSWMYRIATNEAINFLNTKARMVNTSPEMLQMKRVEQLEEDPYFDGDELQIKLQKAIAHLPQKQQIVFNMRYFDEVKYEEMSEILGTSVGALKASYHQARKKIEKYFEE